MSAPSRKARWRARLSHWELDALIAAGIDPASDPALALRAARLTSSRHRRRLASSIERLARSPRGAESPALSSAVPLVVEQVREARDSLFWIAEVLRGPKPVAARGVAMLQRLLTDAGSVLYTESSRGAVELQVRAALDSLAGSATAAEAGISASATPAGRPRHIQTA